MHLSKVLDENVLSGCITSLPLTTNCFYFLPRMHNVHTGGMGGMILKQLIRDKRETCLTKYGGKNIGTAAAVPAVPLPPSLL